MTVQCPRCGTQYRVPESRLAGAHPVFKCTRCEHVFSPGERKKATKQRDEESDDPPNLSFDFEADESAGQEPDGEGEEPAFVGGLATDDPDDSSHEASDKKSSEPEDEIPFDESWEDETSAEEDDWEPEPTRPRARKPRKRAVQARARRRAPAAKRPRRSPLRPVGWSVAVLCLGYLLVAVAFDRRPDVALDLLTRIPVLGKLLGQDHLLAYRMRLEDIEGGLDYIKGNRLAYVVTGRAVNMTPQNIRLIEIEGELIAGGKSRKRQKVYAANQFKRTIRDLSASEVDMLLRLEPNRRFVIPPGESASFLLVFPDPPEDTSEVVCRVVDARAS